MQLQRAAQSAKAIIGIITQASKQREWISFEAGAAWGRDIIYAPLLVGTSLADIPSTLASYQAVNADDSEQFERLLDSLAKALGSTVKRPLRFQQLRHALRVYRGQEETRREDKPETRSDDLAEALKQAFELASENKREEADHLFSELEQGATTLDDKMFARASQFWSQGKKSFDLLLKLDELDESLKNTAEYHYWRGISETSPIKQLNHLQQCLDLKGRPDTYRAAYLKVAKLRHQLNQLRVAEGLLVQGLLGENRLLGAACALEFEAQLPDDQSIAKLAVLVAGLCAHPSEALYERTVSLSSGNAWNAFALTLAKDYDNLFETSSSTNFLGINLQALDLPSLAYEAYTKAMERGTSVAKANVASVVGNAPVPLVGLKILEGHSGAFDAATPHYPHEIRVDLEKKVHDERNRMELLEKHGRQLIQIFTLLVEKGLAAESSGLITGCTFRSGEGLPNPQWRERSYDCVVEPTGMAVLTSQGLPPFKLTPVFPGRGFFICEVNKHSGFVALTPEGGLEGSWLDLTSTTGPLTWFEFTRAEASADTPTP
jgi:hypothetical protein